MVCYVIEKNINLEIVDYLKNKGHIVLENVLDLKNSHVIIVSKVKEFKKALQVIDIGLHLGIEVLCIKPEFGLDSIICNILISEGAKYV